jgi:hypothetical protein
MLDFDQLRTPADHGDTLVEPDPSVMARMAQSNQATLRESDLTLAGVGLREYRRELRSRLGLEERARLAVTGHQPEFIHPGVWAKHVVACRLASAVSGQAVNLVVDSDAPRDFTLEVPGVDDGAVRVRRIRFADVPTGTIYEDVPAADAQSVDRLRAAVAAAMGDRYRRSLMPDFLEALDPAAAPRDWTDQMVFARQVVEAKLGVRMVDHRISKVWFGPLVAEIIANAHRFAACYNGALGEYRRANRVRGNQRPIPDLRVDGPRCEVAAWVHDDSGRRRRLYTERVGDRVRLLADAEPIGETSADSLQRWDRAEACLRGLNGFGFRPRALTLTLWARLCLADLFVHGIGGAKYDRITDCLIHGYFGITPPGMACVSATLRLDLPRRDVTEQDVRRGEHRLRDLRYNPQKHVDCNGRCASLVAARAEAVNEAQRLAVEAPSDRPARRQAFEAIRCASARILEAQPEVMAAYESAVERDRRWLAERRVASRRDYFFALFRAEDLQLLLDRLPASERFRV